MTTSVGERAIHPVVRVFREHKQGIFFTFWEGALRPFGLGILSVFSNRFGK